MSNARANLAAEFNAVEIGFPRVPKDRLDGMGRLGPRCM